MPRQPEQGMSRGSAKRTEARGGRVAVDGRGETRDERGMRRKSKRGWGGWGGGAERGRWWVGWLRRVGGGSLADYVAGWPGERNAGEDAATPCAEEARLLDRGEYIRNVLPPTLYPAPIFVLSYFPSLSIPYLSLLLYSYLRLSTCSLSVSPFSHAIQLSLSHLCLSLSVTVISLSLQCQQPPGWQGPKLN